MVRETGIGITTGTYRSIMTEYVYSIIITCYNKSTTIGRAVNSALAQGPDVEVVIVDDKSSDNSREVLQQLPEDTRLRILYNTKNAGALASYLTGFRAATGQYLMMLDGDDILMPNILNALSRSQFLHPDVCIRLGMAPLEPHGEPQNSKIEKLDKSFSFSPGHWFAVTQNTGGTAYLFPKTVFEKADLEWDQLVVQDHVLPGVISFYCKSFVKLKTIGYKFEMSASSHKLGNQAYRKNCDRILSDLQIYKRARTLNINHFARGLLKLALIYRTQKYLKKYGLKQASSTASLLFSKSDNVDKICRETALEILSLDAK
jgi:glycosyltransferase involved in cell wall biosynthesis